MSIVLVGQSKLTDNLMYRSSMALASRRIVARNHIEGLAHAQLHEYLLHHLDICAVEHDLFDAYAVSAIHQGSGGLFRKTNHLAHGAIIVAAKNKSITATTGHFLTAATEVF